MNVTLEALGQKPIPEDRRRWLCAPPLVWLADLESQWTAADESMRSGNCALEFRIVKDGKGLKGAHVLVKKVPKPTNYFSTDIPIDTLFFMPYPLNVYGPYGSFGYKGKDRMQTRYAVSDESGVVRFEKLPHIPIKIEVLVPTSNFEEAAREWELWMEVEPGKYRIAKRYGEGAIDTLTPPAVVRLKEGETVHYPKLVVKRASGLKVKEWNPEIKDILNIDTKAVVGATQGGDSGGPKELLVESDVLEYLPEGSRLAEIPFVQFGSAEEKNKTRQNILYDDVDGDGSDEAIIAYCTRPQEYIIDGQDQEAFFRRARVKVLGWDGGKWVERWDSGGWGSDFRAGMASDMSRAKQESYTKNYFSVVDITNDSIPEILFARSSFLAEGGEFRAVGFNGKTYVTIAEVPSKVRLTDADDDGIKEIICDYDYKGNKLARPTAYRWNGKKYEKAEAGPSALLPGSRISIAEALSGEGYAFTVVCEIVGQANRLSTNVGITKVEQKFRFAEMLYNPMSFASQATLHYKLIESGLHDEAERTIGKGEKIIWIMRTRREGGYEGIKALADTAENRKLIQATIEASVATGKESAWSEAVAGVRCKLEPSSFDILAGERLDFFFYIHNVSDSPITIGRKTRWGQLGLCLNGRFVGHDTTTEYRFERCWSSTHGIGADMSFSEELPLPFGDGLVLEPGDVVRAALPVGELRTFTYGEYDIHSLDNTGNPGIYRIHAVYAQPNTLSQPGMWKGKMLSPEIAVSVRFEQPLELDKNIDVNFRLPGGIVRPVFRMASIRFSKRSETLEAALESVISPDMKTAWRVKVKIVNLEGHVIAEKETTVETMGRRGIIRSLPVSIGPWSDEFFESRFQIQVEKLAHDESRGITPKGLSTGAITRVIDSLAAGLAGIGSKYPELKEYRTDAAKRFSDRLEFSYSRNFTHPRAKRAIKASDFGENGFYVRFKCKPMPERGAPAYAMAPPTAKLRNLRLYLWIELATGANPSDGLVDDVQSLLDSRVQMLREIDHKASVKPDEDAGLLTGAASGEGIADGKWVMEGDFVLGKTSLGLSTAEEGDKGGYIKLKYVTFHVPKPEVTWLKNFGGDKGFGLSAFMRVDERLLKGGGWLVGLELLDGSGRTIALSERRLAERASGSNIVTFSLGAATNATFAKRFRATIEQIDQARAESITGPFSTDFAHFVRLSCNAEKPHNPIPNIIEQMMVRFEAAPDGMLVAIIRGRSLQVANTEWLISLKLFDDEGQVLGGSSSILKTYQKMKYRPHSSMGPRLSDEEMRMSLGPSEKLAHARQFRLSVEPIPEASSQSSESLMYGMHQDWSAPVRGISVLVRPRRITISDGLPVVLYVDVRNTGSENHRFSLAGSRVGVEKRALGHYGIASGNMPKIATESNWYDRIFSADFNPFDQESLIKAGETIEGLEVVLDESWGRFEVNPLTVGGMPPRQSLKINSNCRVQFGLAVTGTDENGKADFESSVYVYGEPVDVELTYAKAADREVETDISHRSSGRKSKRWGALREAEVGLRGATGLKKRKKLQYLGLDLADAERVSEQAKLSDLFEEKPVDSGKYQLREEVIVRRHPEHWQSGVVYYVPSKNVFYIIKEPGHPGTGSKTFYGPFDGDPWKRFGIELPRKERKVHGLAIYLVVDPVDVGNPEQVDLEKLRLAAEPILTDKDILEYDWDKHVLKLTSVARKRIPSPKSVWGLPFMVVADGQPCYLGSFWSHDSSYAPKVPVIYSHYPIGDYDTISIDASWLGDADDPRGDIRIRKALEEIGLIEPVEPHVKSVGKLKAFAAALSAYANDNESYYPDELHMLRGYLSEEDFEWAFERVEYLGHGKSRSDDPNTVLAYDRGLLMSPLHITIVFFNDGRVLLQDYEHLHELGIKAVVFPEGAIAAINQFRIMLREKTWDGALSMCSDKVKKEVNEYESSRAFFEAVVPVDEVVAKDDILRHPLKGNYAHIIGGLHFNARIDKDDQPERLWWQVHLYEKDEKWEIEFGTRAIELRAQTHRKERLLDELRSKERAKRNKLHEPRLKRVKAETRLTAEKSRFVIGEPMLFKLELANTGDETFWYDDQQAAVNMSMTVTDEQGRRMAYIAGSYQTLGSDKKLEPGKSAVIFDSLDIAKQYDMSRPGKYKVRFNGERPVLWLTLMEAENDRRIAVDKKNPSNVVEIEVIGRSERSTIHQLMSAEVGKVMQRSADLSMLKAETPFEEALTYLRNSVDPPLLIVVMWGDVQANSDVEPTTPIGVGGLSDVPLKLALELLLKSVSGDGEQLTYVVNQGIIIIATKKNLPKIMETRVYDSVGFYAPQNETELLIAAVSDSS